MDLSLRQWIQTFAKSRMMPAIRTRRSRRHVRQLGIELLEDRVVPSNWLVTNTSSNSATFGSLPWAVAQANLDITNANITFSPSAFPGGAMFTLTSTLTLSNQQHSITIDGSNPGPITISGGNSVQVFSVTSTSGFAPMTIQNLTIANGHGTGGGISNNGMLTLTNDIVTGCSSSSDGGGIYNTSTGVATLTNVTLSNNSAPSSSGLHGGGGAYNAGTNVHHEFDNLRQHDKLRRRRAQQRRLHDGHE